MVHTECMKQIELNRDLLKQLDERSQGVDCSKIEPLQKEEDRYRQAPPVDVEELEREVMGV